MVGKMMIRFIPVSMMLLLVTSSANAFVGGLADGFCLDISTAAEEVEAELEAADLSGFGEKECKTVCKETRNYCKDMASSREDCRADSNKVEEKIDKEECKVLFPQDKQARKDCEKVAKDLKKSCDQDDKDDRKIEDDECKALEDICRSSICGS